MKYKNKRKLKEQNSSRLTHSKKGLAVTKGEGGRRGLRGVMINTHNVGGARGRQHSTEKTSSDYSILLH